MTDKYNFLCFEWQIFDILIEKLLFRIIEFVTFVSFKVYYINTRLRF